MNLRVTEKRFLKIIAFVLIELFIIGILQHDAEASPSLFQYERSIGNWTNDGAEDYVFETPVAIAQDSRKNYYIQIWQIIVL